MPYLAVNDPHNTGILRRLSKRITGFPPIASKSETFKDPYWRHGSRPDVVGRVWDQLGGALPVDCRVLLYGSPALVAPKSGSILAVAWGTSYILRVPPTVAAAVAQAQEAFVRRIVKKGNVDVSLEFGREWVFGTDAAEETQWCRQVFDAAEGLAAEPRLP